MRFAKYSLTQPLNRNLLFCMVAEKATLQLLIARSLFAYRISYSHIIFAYRIRAAHNVLIWHVAYIVHCSQPSQYQLMN